MFSHAPQLDFHPRVVAKLDYAPLSATAAFISFNIESSSELSDVLDSLEEESLAIFEPTPFQDGAYLQTLPGDANNIFVPTRRNTNSSPIQPHDHYYRQHSWKAVARPLQGDTSTIQVKDNAMPSTHHTKEAQEEGPAPKISKCLQHQEDRWDEHYHDLLQYKKKYGNCYIPQNYPEDLALARWARRQRHQYKLKCQRKKSSMSDQRQRLLEKAGFVWNPQTDVWEIRRQELEEYKRKHGDCHVPSRYAENPQLATWVKRQRRQYKQMQKGVRLMRLPMERFEILDNMGFAWKLRSGTAAGRNSVCT